MNNSPYIFSFFTGAGFLDLGFETSGYTTAFINELHKPFLDAYKFSRQKLKLKEPLYKYSLDSVEAFQEINKEHFLNEIISDARNKTNFIGFIAGPPCPDFSVGGKNLGRTGDRGILTQEYIQLVCKFRPDFFLFENVKGLWRTKRHREFFDEVKQFTHENGYVTTEKLVNAIDYGTPQDRDRIILLGFQRSLIEDLGILKGNNGVSTLPDDLFPWRKYAKYSKSELDKLPWPTKTPFIENSIITFPGAIPEDLTVEYWFQKNDVYNHPNAIHFFKPKAGLKRFLTVPEGDDSKKSFKRLHRWRYSPTAAYGNNEVHIHPYRARRITAAEAMAIQSLPKEFELPDNMTLSNMFKTIGNGVPYLLAKAIANSILYFLEGNNETNNN